jgi:hypothetical protein
VPQRVDADPFQRLVDAKALPPAGRDQDPVPSQAVVAGGDIGWQAVPGQVAEVARPDAYGQTTPIKTSTGGPLVRPTGPWRSGGNYY